MEGSLTLLLINQALDSLRNSEEAKQSNRLDKEVQESVNNSLLLGLILEGLINEIGYKTLDSWTWKKLERSSTPLKWRIISGLKKGFEPGQETLQTITKIKKLRDEIAHPKKIDLGNDVYLISDKGKIKINPPDDYVLPTENFNIYFGFGTLYEKFNFENSLKNTEKVFDTITEIVELFEMKVDYGWVYEIKKEINGLNKKYE